MAPNDNLIWKQGDEESNPRVSRRDHADYGEKAVEERAKSLRRSTSRRRSIDPSTALPIQYRSL